ncbi:MAG: matrixin family metalloprotease [Acidimicrobiales bacterium]
MGVIVSLGEGAPIVEPGGSAVFDVSVRNDGQAAESVQLCVAGDAKPYAYVVPASVDVAAGETAVARLGFRLPRASLPAAGPLPYELEAVSGDGRAEVVGRGVLTVAPFSALSTTLEPAEVTGSGASTHQLSVGNRGNSPVSVNLTVVDADDLDIAITPTTVVAAPGRAGVATVEVSPRGRPFRGPDRDLPFTLQATPEVGDAVQTPGRRRVPAAVTGRRLVVSGVVVGAVVIGLVVAALAASGGDSEQTANPVDAPSALASCPAENHTDPRGVSGLRPEDIPNLPNTYSFLYVKGDRCTPLRFNPCDPVHYVQNAALAPPTGAADVREGFARLSEVTGITFVDDGLTDETNLRRNPYQPTRYGQRWAPILVTWSHFGNQGPNPEIQSVGYGIGSRVSDMIVSGVLSLNVDAVTNRENNTPLQGGFGPPIGTGTGAIGPEGVTWGRIILHELAHVIGLGHTRDKGAIMYPESAEQTSRPAEYRPPDKEGLRYLGREAGCLQNPPLPAS